MDTLEGTWTDIAKCGNTNLEFSSREIYLGNGHGQGQGKWIYCMIDLDR